VRDPDELPPRAREASTWRRYLHFWRTRVAADVDDELRFHVEMLVQRNRALGMSPDDARRAAERRLGDLTRHAGDCVTIAGRRERRASRALAVDALVQDLRYALRTLARQKTWTAAAVLTLALGIGATTAVFSVLNGLILNQLPYRAADRVVIPWRQDLSADYTMFPAQREVAAWRTARSIEGIQSYATRTVQLTAPGAEPVMLPAASIGSGFMRFAGIGTILGRGFDTTETQIGGARSVVLSEDLWRTRFGASRDVLGRRITLDDTAYTIVGVASEKLRLPSNLQPTTDLWLPFVAASRRSSPAVLARLAPGVPLDAAQRELDSLTARSDQQPGSARRLHTVLQRPRDAVYISGTIYLFSAAVAAIFLIACVNVAQLTLARGAARQRELAIRAALGAKWSRIARQLVTESLVIAIAGGAAGIGLAVVSLRWLATLRPDSMAQLDRAQLDRPVLLLTIAATVVTGLLFGLVAAMQRSRRDTDTALKSTATSGTATRGQSHARALLVAAEMALSAMLLVGAVLVVRSAIKLQEIDPGFDPAHLYAVRVARPTAAHGANAQTKPVVDALVERAERLPGVTSVTVASETPPNLGMMVMPLEVQTERGTYVDSGTMFIPTLTVRPDFFAALGVRMRDGASFSTGADTRHEMIINESLARRLWPGQRAVGRHLRFAARDPKDADPWNTVVGVVNDIAVHGAWSLGKEPLLYYPDDGSAREVLFRTLQPVAVVAELRQTAVKIGGPSAKLSLVDVHTDLAKTTATQRFTTLLLASFAIIALALAAIGLYGVLAYSVAQRTREIGVRMAIGASPLQVAGDVMRSGISVSVVGLAVGLIAAVWGTRLVSSILFGVTQHDPLSYGISGLLLMTVAVAACAVPTRRAMAVDPVIAMRGDADRSW
jgi:putative ABC transport system permease protein